MDGGKNEDLRERWIERGGEREGREREREREAT